MHARVPAENRTPPQPGPRLAGEEAYALRAVDNRHQVARSERPVVRHGHEHAAVSGEGRECARVAAAEVHEAGARDEAGADVDDEFDVARIESELDHRVAQLRDLRRILRPRKRASS